MDLRTGKTYDSELAALADGVPQSDLIDLRREPFRSVMNPKYPKSHQGARERARRERQMAKAKA
jgi:hypothetical protein